MHHHCSEIRAEEFLQHFLPGEDPFTKDVGGFYTIPATILTGNVSGKVLDAEIVGPLTKQNIVVLQLTTFSASSRTQSSGRLANTLAKTTDWPFETSPNRRRQRR